jgi:hypothetical protein
VASVEFYDVKYKKKVMIDESKIVKVTFTTKNGGLRYGIRGTTGDGRPLTKFVNKATWDSMKVPEAK